MRHTGWIALYSGMSAGADVIVIPKYPLKAYGTYYEKLSVVGRLKMVSLEEFLKAKIFFG
ncbi:hypothetical protein LM594_04245 [Candidatus Caldipriscus sp.]|nr:hypothetical protein [Candidatus Caldipriscus sp.]